jgi:hypothetical protein
VFHDKDDFVLYTSTKEFVEDPGSILQTDPYRTLGSWGDTIATVAQPLPRTTFRSVNELIKIDPAILSKHFPFQALRSGPQRAVDRARKFKNYNGINLLKLAFNAKRFKARHRYLFTCKPVVDEVLRLLK